MRKFKVLTTILMIGLTNWAGWAMANNEKPFSSNVVSATGAINVLENYTEWPTLGTWAHAKVKGEPGLQEYHVVYTQPGTIKYYKKKGRFPDGAVLVKELLNGHFLMRTIPNTPSPKTTEPIASHATRQRGSLHVGMRLTRTNGFTLSAILCSEKSNSPIM